METRWESSTARQEITLHRDSPRIDVALHVDWHEKHRMLKLSLPVAVERGTLAFEVPYGVIERPATGREEPGQRWIDLTGYARTTSGEQIRYGVSLLNDGRYGFDCLERDLRMTILRSPIYCFHDPAKPDSGQEYLHLDQGTHTLCYALLPHAEGWEEAGTVRHALDLNDPIVGVFQYPHPGEWGPSGALLAVEPKNVVACVLKGAEDGDALVLRLFETEGRPTEARVSLARGPHFETHVGAFELKTLRLEPDGRIRDVDLLED